ncbi:red chlorophyll catabolite reductase, chloroplastic [Ricinus communis]|uniref:Red chlorophyll catabolite reductase, chloroplast, putative n=1 Tax=Ricinus communis TaxID=3988 RepID=B9SC57_RICCO|nr:red chlorophyll catabolite reductase, chloroplastic [Ricinus communis]EEF38771.1 Red chlorophyll catabolite reductase, chloroplast precursor, putative [Ricinus communis]|eukprot:XP_002523576.1 red chlorophyll catabolite reductase, chloroplastic [Ricinus communis]
MAISFCHVSHFPFTAKPSLPLKSSRSPFFAASSSSSIMELHNQGRSRFLEFPFVSVPQRELMVDLLSAVENRLGSQLLPCTLPPDVQYCRNQSGNAQAAFHIRSANQNSPVDFILGSWLHCKLPTGAALNITSLSAYLNLSTDAPNFLIELIQSSPTSLVLIIDLPPRKDLVLYPDYLQTFYENSQLEAHRQTLQKLKEVQPYVTSSLYLRSFLSPTAIMILVETEAGESGRMEEIIKDQVGPVAKAVFGVWLDKCACGGREVEEEEKAYLKKRDELVKKKIIEIDLASNFPRMFGPELADRILGAIQKIYNV